jgi:hypothetical protein
MTRAYNTATTQQNTGGAIPTFLAGKNKIINGDFNVNQRAFTSITANGFGFDCFAYIWGDGSATYSAQAFTAGTAPVVGYEAKNFARIVTASQTAANAYTILQHRLEDVRTLAGQTATLSFWAKAGTGTPKIAVELEQIFGSGGSPSGTTQTYFGQITLSTSWTRYSITIAMPSLSGKTIGTTANTSYLLWNLWTSAGSSYNSRSGSLGIQNATIDIWGIQLEAGSVATPFTLAGGGSQQAELALCQRYYFRTQIGTGIPYMGVTVAGSSTTTYANIIHKVTMRTTPTSIDFSGLKWQSINNSGNISAASISDATPENTLLVCTTTGATTAQMNYLIGQTASAYIGFNAEF